jgi:hypothetical protein
MRALLLVGLLLLVALPAASSAARPIGKARLTITVWPDGTGEGKASQTWTLRCRPAGGTHPAPGRACRRLFSNLGALRPVPGDRACRTLLGGPQKAFIRGSIRGKRVRAAFNLQGSCEVARWNRLGVLFPGVAASSRPASASLQITVWPEGIGAGSYRHELACDPDGGTYRNPARLCNALLGMRAPFGPFPSERPCTLQWGGPQVAAVQGRFRGEDVAARFNRTDGCEIWRWDRVAFLFAPA